MQIDSPPGECKVWKLFCQRYQTLIIFCCCCSRLCCIFLFCFSGKLFNLGATTCRILSLWHISWCNDMLMHASDDHGKHSSSIKSSLYRMLNCWVNLREWQNSTIYFCFSIITATEYFFSYTDPKIMMCHHCFMNHLNGMKIIYFKWFTLDLCITIRFIQLNHKTGQKFHKSS